MVLPYQSLATRLLCLTQALPTNMLVLALEYDRAQAAAVRRIVCDVVGARLILVGSIAEALRALREQPPDVILLPALIAPAEEAELLQALRKLPTATHIETFITPLLGARDEPPATTLQRWRRRSARRSSDPSSLGLGADQVFAERLLWSLERVRHLKPSDQDRRRFQRFRASELPGFQTARIKFGPFVALVDVSSGGALLESSTRLRPESEAMLELVGELRTATVPVRVLRCHVAGVDDGLRYLGACAFKQPVDLENLLVEATPGGLLVPRGHPLGLPALDFSTEPIPVRNCW
jgi:CheY-like chemotaxis protein